ncbi:hypothetical protein [Bacillus sp. FJAT-44742]|uniref:hypothetical protein n=1 Tax=Bacillus sp. FJAT-44742 TaxID=2014005 RepID=UPI000C24DD54|nr:hypothetical protein [Bacillus sp. FJAT-44742]
MTTSEGSLSKTTMSKSSIIIPVYKAHHLHAEKLENKKWITERIIPLYYPYNFQKWEIHYKSFFKKPKLEKRVVASNLIKGDSSFADEWPSFSLGEVKENQIIPSKVEKSTYLASSREMVRRFYVHYARVWNVPRLELIEEKTAYLPYEVHLQKHTGKNQTRTMLYEPVSGHAENLDKYPEIHSFFTTIRED